MSAKAVLAAKIARIDREKFNGAIADGYYTCAPKTVRGASRIFDVNDIVCMTIYGRMLENLMTPLAAGKMACGLRDYLKNHPDAERAIYIQSAGFGSAWMGIEDYDKNAGYLGGYEIMWVSEFRLKEIRERVTRELATPGAA